MENECCICKKKFECWGNNPDGAKWLDKEGNVVSPLFKPTDVCCNECNNRYVILGRMYTIYNGGVELAYGKEERKQQTKT